jgi:hypothetical protein
MCSESQPERYDVTRRAQRGDGGALLSLPATPRDAREGARGWG